MAETSFFSGHLPATNSSLPSNLSDKDTSALDILLKKLLNLRPVDAQRWKDLLCECVGLSETLRPHAIRHLLGKRLKGTQDAGLIKGMFRSYANNDQHRGEFTLALANAILDQGQQLSIYQVHAIVRPIYREISFHDSWYPATVELLERLENSTTFDFRCIFFLSALIGWRVELDRCLALMLSQANSLPSDSPLRYPLSRWINYAINLDSESCHQLRGTTRELYDDVMQVFQDQAKISFANHQLKKQENSSPVLLVTFSSFWDYRNAPTWIIFNYLRIIARRFPDHHIHILNTDGRQYPMEMFCWIAPSFMNRRIITEEEKDWQRRFFEDMPNVQFHYWSDYFPMNTHEGWDNGHPALFDFVSSLEPDLILAVHYEMLGQAFLGSIPTVHYPMTTVFSNWLETDCQIYWGNAPLSEVYKDKGPPIPLEKIGEQRLGVNPSYEDNHQYSRQDLNLPDDAIVVVSVGTRLEREINTPLVKAMVDQMQQHSNLIWLLVGTGATIPSLDNLGATADQVIVRAFDDHIEAIYPLCDIYLNPPRPGGGFSAAMAMNHNVPVLNSGTASDVGMYLSTEFIDKNLEEMIQRLNSWINDASLRKVIARQQRERLLTEFSVEKAVDSLLPILSDTVRRFWCEKGKKPPVNYGNLFDQGLI